MKGNISKAFILRLEKEFMDISGNLKDVKEGDLKKYSERRAEEIEKIAHLEEMRVDDKVSVKEYFNKFFYYCSLNLSVLDKDEFVRETLGDNYSLCVLKTGIPSKKLVPDSNGFHSVNGLLEGTFAIRNDVEINKERIF